MNDTYRAFFGLQSEPFTADIAIYVGFLLIVRFMISQTVFHSNPSFERITSLLLSSYSIGPLVSSDTLRLFHAR
jgi:hypothetical protein